MLSFSAVTTSPPRLLLLATATQSLSESVNISNKNRNNTRMVHETGEKASDKRNREESPHSAARVASVSAGTGEVLRRDIKPLEILALGFNICNSWIAIATSLAIAISAGGTVTVIYGIVVISFSYGAIGITLAELASVYPTAGGQYHFASILSPHRFNRAISYICGLAAVTSWIFLAAAITILSSQLLLTVPSFYIETYTAEPWHYFLVFQAINAIMLAYNIFCLKKAPWTHNIGCKSIISYTLLKYMSCFPLCSHGPIRNLPQ